MATLIVILVGLTILCKVVKIFRDVALSILSIVASLLGILLFFRYFYKWILLPLWKSMLWIARNIKNGFFALCDFLDRHYLYRDNDKYWKEVATSKDRKLII